MATEPQEWARVLNDTRVPMRRGAWYRIVRLTPVEVVVDINGRPTTVPRPSVQILPTAPTRWAVVPRPANAVRMPLSWGPRYGVCPNCRERAPLHPRTVSMRCPRCNGHFDIGWDDAEGGG